MRVERFFHIRPDLNNGGATVRVVGNTEQVGQVDVQVAYCHSHTTENRGDPYCKATGRDYATKSPMKIVPLRYLPRELERIQAVVARRTGGFVINDFNFSMKYFLPKE